MLYIVSRKAETRRRILAAALACAADARADCTMGEVAIKAGLSRQAVYLHFPNRDALLAALSEWLAAAAARGPADAPSARATLTALVAWLADDYPRSWPLIRRLGENPEDAGRQIACRKLAERFRDEGALSPHLSPATAADLLFTLTSPAVWAELVPGRGWDAGRYRSHVTYLATSALTK
ncbi:MAG: TetR/AcrR family transcriptional regulator [Alphaproteobacteria bacterium]|nr:TetR/AcrR family transcriptional regulator [Alphaproteobacteria bacterium]